MRVAVVGGGITGLAACYELEKCGVGRIVLFEATDHLGGKLYTDRCGDMVVEHGPDAIFARHAEILEFIEELGLADQLIEPSVRGFSMYLDGSLRPVPSGLTRVSKIDPAALADFPYLSDAGKEVARAERMVAPNLELDESVASFFRRRFGPEYAQKIAEPLFAGTHGGRSEELSMDALYPDYRKAERAFGSLAAAADAGALSSAAKFINFKCGSQALADAIVKRLEWTEIKKQSVGQLDHHLKIGGESFDAIILAVPAHEAAKMLPQIAEFNRFEAASSLIVTLRYPVPLSLNGTGFLVPAEADLPIRGATLSSHKWAGRANPSHSLLRVFLPWSDDSDEELIAEAKRGLKEVISLPAEPDFEQVHRWPKGLPIYRLGHRQKVDHIQSTLLEHAPIYLAGQSYRGVGIPDCVKQGREAARLAAQSGDTNH